MKTIRVLLTGILIWIGGLTIYSLSYFVPILENPDRQADIALTFAILPLAVLGAHFYYQKHNGPSGYKVGLILVLIAILLDALITVPYIIPNRGAYKEFFVAPGFWLIALEYYLAVVLYWQLKIRISNKKSINP